MKLSLLEPPVICYGADMLHPHSFLKFEAIFKEGIYGFHCSMADAIPPYPAVRLTPKIQSYLDTFMAFLGSRPITFQELSQITCSCYRNKFLTCDCDLGCMNMHPDWYEAYKNILDKV